MKRNKNNKIRVLCPECKSSIIREEVRKKMFMTPNSNMHYDFGAIRVDYKCSKCEYHCKDIKELIIEQPKQSILAQIKLRFRQTLEKYLK